MQPYTYQVMHLDLVIRLSSATLHYTNLMQPGAHGPSMKQVTNAGLRSATCSPVASGGVQSELLLTQSLTVYRFKLRAQEEFT